MHHLGDKHAGEGLGRTSLWATEGRRFRGGADMPRGFKTGISTPAGSLRTSELAQSDVGVARPTRNFLGGDLNRDVSMWKRFQIADTSNASHGFPSTMTEQGSLCWAELPRNVPGVLGRASRSSR
jgi:hypothetical protein